MCNTSYVSIVSRNRIRTLQGRHTRRLVAAAVFCTAITLAPSPLARGQCPLSFSTYYPRVGSGPIAVAIGDLDGDGWGDLTVARQGAGLAVLLGRGDGTFRGPFSYGAGGNPHAVAIGDVNSDGKPDLAVANNSSNNVSVLLGNGDGTFQAAVSYGAGTTPYSVAIGDLNGDGRPDLAVANNSSNNVSVLLGNGDGTFQAAVSYGAGISPRSVAVGDLNGNGTLDLVAANESSNNVSVLLGNGDGTFQAAAHYGAGTTPYSVAIGDLNGDGRPDLAVADYSGGVWVVLGNGDGTFAMAVNFGGGFGLTSVAVGDLNDDGQPDLAMGSNWDDRVSVLQNSGASIGITHQPVGRTVTAGQNAIFSVTATGALSYRWRRNGALLVNGGRLSGVSTSMLTITGALPADAGVYDVQMASACNAGVNSQPAALGVNPCRGDFNLDGAFNGLDVQGFVNALLAGQTCP